jgi:hypothetical protein
MAEPIGSPQAPPSRQRAAVERRAAERFPSDLVAAVHPLALPKKEAVAARVKDVSADGISLVVRYRFLPGTVLVIDLDGAPDQFGRPLLGRVVHATPQGDGRWVLGCALRRQLSADQLQACRAAPDGEALARAAAGAEADD